jgi:glycosyltransferase involved in cell wall biosynthesis
MSKNVPLVSILIPNHNRCEYLGDCLESALGQSYPNIEVIVIDDGSTDDSLVVLERYKKNIQLISTSNQGAAAARNIGISNAKGKFIAFLDSDDTWALDKISLQIDRILKTDCDLVYCSGNVIEGNEISGQIITAQFSGNCYSYFKQFPTRAIIVLGCSGALLRASHLEVSGNFDETFYGAAEDWDFFRRYCKSASVELVPEALINYRRHKASISQRPIIDWYHGNAKAVKKLIAEDPEIGLLESKIIWTKFQIIALKTCIKNVEIKLALKVILELFLPTYRRG